MFLSEEETDGEYSFCPPFYCTVIRNFICCNGCNGYLT